MVRSTGELELCGSRLAQRLCNDYGVPENSNTVGMVSVIVVL